MATAEFSKFAGILSAALSQRHLCMSFKIMICNLDTLKNNHSNIQHTVSIFSSTLLVKLLSCVRLFATPWTVAYQAPLSMRFSRQEYWSGLPFPSPGDLPDPGIEPGSSALQADALPSEPPGKSGYS